jgi:DNA-directed RNA polymerase specialized sigma24 family protein
MSGHVALSSVISKSGRNVQVPFEGSNFTKSNSEASSGTTQPLSIRELCQKIGQEYGIKPRPTYDRMVRETKRDVTKMTQEQMAVAIAQDMSGKHRLSPIDKHNISSALYASIKNMVYQLSNQFSATCKDSAEDLAGDCMLRIVTQLWRYTPSRGKFTTWSWYVCRGVLDKKYEETKRFKGVIVDEGHLTTEEGDSMFENMPDRPIEGVQHNECQGVMAKEIHAAVRDLAKDHPNEKKLLFEMFGDPDDAGCALPAEVNIINAAKAAGIEYGRARVFYSTVVRPFFKNKFVGC